MFDVHSDTWRAVAVRLVEEIESARLRLEQPGRPSALSDYDRGRIALARDILAMAEPPAAPRPLPTWAD